MTANTPPKPHTEGMEWTNTETGIKYMFTNGGWRAISSEASEEVAEAIDNLDLQKVLDKGNVADKGAEFLGKVKVQPGTTGNEVVTYQQLAELDQEIEDIRPSIDRGEWLYTPGNSSISSGQYIAYKLKIDGTYCNELYAACLLTAGDDSDAKAECNRKYMDCGVAADDEDPDFNANWEYCDFIKLHKTDVNGRLHTFSDAEGGMYVEIFNNDGSGFGLFQIIPNGVAGGGGQAIGLYVTHVHSEGTPNGNARVKMFEMASANPADYVSKAGDSMLGALNIRGFTSDSAPSLSLRPQDSKGSNSDVLKVYGTDGHGKFWVTLEGDISASSSWSPTQDRHLATKEYVDTQILQRVGPATHKWKFIQDGDKNTLQPGEFTGPKEPTYGKGKHYSYYFHPKSLTGEMEFYKDYNMYFPMNALWGAFHYINNGRWKIKQYVPVRNINVFNDDNYLEIYTHTDYPSGGDVISAFDDGTEYYFAIGGMI